MPVPRRLVSTHRRNHVCLEHRTASRADAARCPVCNSAMREIGTRWRVPKKTDDRGWRELREMLRQFDLRVARFHATRFSHFGISVVEEKLPSEYRPEYRLRRMVRRPGA